MPTPRGLNITHVVTAGSPEVQVPSLENTHDVVPHLNRSDDPAVFLPGRDADLTVQACELDRP